MIEQLKEARDRIRDKKHWCRKHLYQNDAGIACGEEDATKWCALGTLVRTFGNIRLESVEIVLGRVCLENFNTPSIIIVNDDHGHEAVLTCFDKLIERLETAIPQEQECTSPTSV